MPETLGLVCVEALETVGGWDAMISLDVYLDGERLIAVAADDRQGWAVVLAMPVSVGANGSLNYRLVTGNVEFRPLTVDHGKGLEWGRLAGEHLRARLAGVDLRPKV